MNTIDKIIKNKLSHHHAETPDGAWDMILSRLPEERKNFRPWWVIASMIAMAMASVSAFMFFNKDLNYHDSIIRTKNEINGPVATIKPFEFENILNSGKIAVNDMFDTKKRQFDGKKSKKPTGKNGRDLASLTIKKADFLSSENDYIITDNIRSDHAARTRSNFYPEQITNNLQGKNIRHYHNLIFKLRSKLKDYSICPSIQPIKKRKSIDFYVSHDYGYKSLAAISGESLPYENSRKSTEKSLYSYSAGIRTGFEISKKWTIQSGVNYSQINERFQYIDPESNQTREITIKDYVYQNGKIVDSIINIQTVVIPGETQIKVQNRYKTFDIPVLGKYTLLKNSRMSISAVAGLYLNITSTQSGMIFDRDSKSILDISKESVAGREVFKTYLGVTTFGALSLAYHITPNIDLIAEPNVRLQTQSITSDLYPLAQRFNTYGLLSGVRYNF